MEFYNTICQKSYDYEVVYIDPPTYIKTLTDSDKKIIFAYKHVILLSLIIELIRFRAIIFFKGKSKKRSEPNYNPIVRQTCKSRNNK